MDCVDQEKSSIAVCLSNVICHFSRLKLIHGRDWHGFKKVDFHGSLRLSNSLKDFHLFMDGCLLSRHLFRQPSSCCQNLLKPNYCCHLADRDFIKRAWIMAAGLGSLALHAIFPVVDTRGGGQQFSIPPRKCPFNKTLVSVCISICQNQIASTVYKKSKKEQRNF